MGKLQKISVLALAMLITGAVDGVGNLPSIALFGEKLVFFLIAAALLFLIPISIVSAKLAEIFPENCGIYSWSKRAFGKKLGVITLWLQWINTMVWFPTCLSTIAGTLAYLIDPGLAQNKYYLISVSLAAFWVMTFLNLKGIKTSTKIASTGTILGMVIPIGVIIVLSLIWLALGYHSHFQLTSHNAFPSFTQTSSWNALTAIITAFLGMELAAVHLPEMQNASQVFSKALAYSVLTILLTLGVGSIGVSVVIPQHEINLVSGSVQAVHYFLNDYHVAWLTPLFALILLGGSLGTMVNWLISPAKGLLQAATDGYLPKSFCQLNKYGVPHNVLLFQAIIVSLICFSFLMMPSVNGSYWFLLDLSTQLYVLMYLVMFCAAWKFSKALAQSKVLPCSNKFIQFITLLGLLGCAITLMVGFFKPDNINVGSTLRYEFMFCGGLMIMIFPAILLLLPFDSIHISNSKKLIPLKDI